MLKYIFGIIMLLHGLIHFMGFAKAYNYGTFSQFTEEISRTLGVLWLATGMLFIVSVYLFLIKKDVWINFALPAGVLSQIVIITSWNDAKSGTLVNIILLIAIFLAWNKQQFNTTIIKTVNFQLQKSNNLQTDVLLQKDIKRLPILIQKYITYSGALGKPKVKNMKIVFDGEMRERGKNFFKFQSVQYNFFDEPTRLFFMKAKRFNGHVTGYHCYQNKVMPIF